MRFSYHDEQGNIIDFYEILNIPYEAKKMEVRSAFCNLVKIYHPDLSGKESENERRKLDLVIKGYKILINDNLRKDYNTYLFNRERFSYDGYVYIPKTRIKYSISLKDLIISRLLSKEIKRKERIYNFGQDIEIFITPSEARKGAISFIELPSRTPCPLCYGDDKFCRLCQGIGRVSSTSNLEVRIPPGTINGAITDIDLIKVRPDKLTTFRMKNLRIRISIIGKDKFQTLS